MRREKILIPSDRLEAAQLPSYPFPFKTDMTPRHSLLHPFTLSPFHPFLILILLLWIPFLGADIAFYGDTQAQEGVHRRIVEAIAAREPELAFHMGDLTGRGSKQSHYDKFFEIESPLVSRCPIWPVRGNHERSTELFLDSFPHLNGSSHYTVEHDSLLFIALDSTQELTPGSDQFKWLRQTLDANPGIPKIVLMHHPMFSSGPHADEQGHSLFLPVLFQRQQVKAVISGHDHHYERLIHAGVTYLITGGGGGELRDRKTPSPHSLVFRKQHHYLIASRECNRLNFGVYGLDGDLLDSFCILLTP